MILDTSAVVALARNEPEAAEFRLLVRSADRAAISTASVLEASLVLRDRAGQHFLADFVDGIVTPVSFDTHQLAAARAAHERFGRGSGHRARLNFGDCFSYALAITTGEPLLFKGDDFTYTDVTRAYLPD
jgi:ribonuclease VapC